MAANQRFTAFALCGSALILAVFALLIWNGTLDVGVERELLSPVLLLAAVADLGVAAYFFTRTP